MQRFTITTDRIREAWLKMAGGTPATNQRAERGLTYSWQFDPEHYGIKSIPEMTDWLLNGYDPEGDPLDVDNSGMEDITVPEMLYDDEDGMLMIDAVLSGEDLYRVKWEDTPSPKSIEIVAQINMLAMTPASVLGEYCDFILRAVDAAKAMGAAPALSVQHLVNGCWPGVGLTEITIPLVKAGEEIDPVSWRAFVSKGSFRTLGFMARLLIGQDIGKQTDSGMGHSAGPGWKVTKEGDRITINCPPSAIRFPAEDMERQLAEALAS